MSKEGPKRKVDLDLDALQPPPRTIQYAGKVYELPGSASISTINRLLQLDEAFRVAQESTDALDANRALQEMYEMVMDLFRQRDPEVPDLDLSMEDMQQVTGLVISGEPVDLDEAVRATLQGEDDEAAQAEAAKVGSLPPPKAPPVRRTSRTPSRKPSPARS